MWSKMGQTPPHGKMTSTHLGIVVSVISKSDIFGKECKGFVARKALRRQQETVAAQREMSRQAGGCEQVVQPTS